MSSDSDNVYVCVCVCVCVCVRVRVNNLSKVGKESSVTTMVVCVHINVSEKRSGLT